MTVDLSTTYLGLRLRSPIVASASPMTGDPGRWNDVEEAGAGAIVLPSLFEEQIERDSFAVEAMLDQGTDVFAEALNYHPDVDDYDLGPARHLALVKLARERLSIPVIASLNGTTPGGWVRYARHLENAGAHAIELNVYDVVADPRPVRPMSSDGISIWWPRFAPR
jgi:dihydroorotate dehydrogenase (fumarate)